MTLRKDTNSGHDPKLDTSCPVPDDAKRADGQYVDHWVLPDEERARGFIRPVRTAYRHVGIAGPQYPLADLTPEQAARFGDEFAKYEAYPPGTHGSALGRFWTQADIDRIGKGCGCVTTMPRRIAETYAREPGFYGSTFCAGCGAYFQVGPRGEFVWDGTSERVGT